MEEWISVKDNLPPSGEVVDIWADNGRKTDYTYIRSAYGKRGNDFFNPEKNGLIYRVDSVSDNVTHWRRLPKPPTKKKSTEQRRNDSAQRVCRELRFQIQKYGLIGDWGAIMKHFDTWMNNTGKIKYKRP